MFLPSLPRHTLHALLWVMTLSVEGCLIPPPTPLEEPERITPSVYAEQAVPSLLTPVQTSSSGANLPEFLVPFVSDDLGELVVGKLYLNYDSDNISIIGSTDVTPSTLDAGDRPMRVTWLEPEKKPAGCYSVTLAITHLDNYTRDFLREVPIDNEKTAFTTWWVAHDIPLQDVNLLDCESSAMVSAP